MALPTDAPLPEKLTQRPVADLVEVLIRLRLLVPGQVKELTEQVLAGFPDPRALARELIQRGWLTPYQVNQLLQDRGAQLVLGSYVILERLGEGGMGQVFKARHQNLERIVALKVIRKDRLSHGDAVQRFHREIQAVAQLSHPNVVTAFDADQVGDTHFFAMEYVEGIDLGRLVKQEGPLPIEQACDYVRQAALGLQHAHERGLVHRDIKPSNLLIADCGLRIADSKEQSAIRNSQSAIVKILDLGLALLAGTGEEELTDTLTHEGVLMGTPDFIAPEQARNSHLIDTRADLYSLGCTLYYLLAGRVPFPADTVTEKLYKQWMEEPDPIEKLRPDVPSGLTAVVRRLMAKRPEDRYPSAAALAAALLPGAIDRPPEAIWVNRPGNAAVAAVPVSLSSSTMLQTDAPVAVPLGRKRIGAWVGAVAGCVVLGLAILGVALASRGRRSSGPMARSNANSPRDHAAEATSELNTLISRFGDRKEDQTSLRRDLLAFQLRFADEPGALVAASMVMQLPSPLDPLQSRDIPKGDRWKGRPSQLLAVLGESRRRHWKPARCAVFHPEGQILASGGEDGVRLWDATTGNEQAFLAAGPVIGLAYLGDGKTLATAGADGRITTWDPVTEKKQTTGPGPVDPVRCAVFAADGESMAWGLEDGRVIFGSRQASSLGRLKGHKGPVRCLAFSSDGKTLASGGEDGLIKIWDIATAAEIGRLTGHEGAVLAVAFGPKDKTLASGGEDQLLHFWDVANQKELIAREGPVAPVTSLRYVDQGKTLVWGDAEGGLFFFNHATAETADGFKEAHTGPVAGLAYSSRDRLLASVGVDGLLQMMDVPALEMKESRASHMSSVSTVAFSPDGRSLATGSADRTVKVWDLVARKQRASLKGHMDCVSSVAFASDGRRLASGSWDGCVKIWQLDKSKLLETLPVRRGQVLSVAWSLDGRTLAAAGWASERKATTGNALEFGELTLWDTVSWRQRASVQNLHRSAATAVALSPSSKVGATGSRNGTIKLWDWALARERATMDNGAGIRCVVFHPSGNLLAAGGEKGKVHFWDTTKADRKQTLPGHAGPVTGVAFAPDGRAFVSVDLAGGVIVWDWSSGKRLLNWQLPGPVHGVAFAPDGRHIATANGNGTAYLFRLKPYQSRW